MNGDGAIHDELRITCADAVELVTDFMESALSSRDLDDFTAHLRACQACAVFVDQVERTVAMAPGVRDEEGSPPDAVAEELVAELTRRRRSV